MFKNYIFYFLLNLIVVQVFGQTFGDFSFSGLPQDYQLYPRNSKNVSDVSIKVKNTNNSTASIGLLVYRNATLVKVLKPSPSANLTTFTYSIPAELAEYDFHWYTYSGRDSTLLVKRSNIVSGDVILVSGQSNAKLGSLDNVYNKEWLRTYGKNKVITDLIQALGVKIEIDYTDDKNYKTLNYGKVILLTDADVDKFSQQQVAARFRDRQCNYLV